MYERILVPTDGSEEATAAVEHAIDLARRYDAALSVLSVVDTTAGIGASYPGSLDALDDAAEDAIDGVTERAQTAGVESIEGVAAHGTPHQAILDFADEKGVDLIVMGTHGRTGLDRYLIGSVTEKVVRLSDVPVLTVRAPETVEE